MTSINGSYQSSSAQHVNPVKENSPEGAFHSRTETSITNAAKEALMDLTVKAPSINTEPNITGSVSKNPRLEKIMCPQLNPKETARFQSKAQQSFMEYMNKNAFVCIDQMEEEDFGGAGLQRLMSILDSAENNFKSAQKYYSDNILDLAEDFKECAIEKMKFVLDIVGKDSRWTREGVRQRQDMLNYIAKTLVNIGDFGRAEGLITISKQKGMIIEEEIISFCENYKQAGTSVAVHDKIEWTWPRSMIINRPEYDLYPEGEQDLAE
ncbi:MAG: hypothetical protein WCF65_00865 [Parachlamydiaceae bacterium]